MSILNMNMFRLFLGILIFFFQIHGSLAADSTQVQPLTSTNMLRQMLNDGGYTLGVGTIVTNSSFGIPNWTLLQSSTNIGVLACTAVGSNPCYYTFDPAYYPASPYSSTICRRGYFPVFNYAVTNIPTKLTGSSSTYNSGGAMAVICFRNTVLYTGGGYYFQVRQLQHILVSGSSTTTTTAAVNFVIYCKACPDGSVYDCSYNYSRSPWQMDGSGNSLCYP
jgi:hypothetical protein